MPKAKTCTDHLGNTYPTRRDMCEKYGITVTTFSARIYGEWPLEEALTTPVRSINRICKDHLGNIYKNEKEMCEIYGISLKTFRQRRKDEWSLEKALTTPVQKQKHPVEDHHGNKYSASIDMYEKYDIKPGTFKGRLERGWTLEDTLATPSEPIIKPCSDHLGNIYPSTSDMCKTYKIKLSTFKIRLKHGWPLEKALTTPVSGREIHKDHLGNEYRSVFEMCDAYKISLDAFNCRIKNGWSVEKALTEPVKTARRPCKDHLGNQYDSLQDMCSAYGISIELYRRRRKSKKWSLEKSLTEPEHETANTTVKDHLCNEYPSVYVMCQKYGIDSKTYQNRINRGWSLEKALTTVPGTIVTTSQPCEDHLGNKYPSRKAMCDAYGIKTTLLLSRIRIGWSLEKALTTPSVTTEKTDYFEDHLGNRYPSLTAMCDAYGISITTYEVRKKNGWTMKQRLTTQTGTFHKCANKCKDHLGNEYPSETAMCDAYNINASAFRARMKKGWTLEKALTTPPQTRTHNYESITGMKQLNDHLTIVKYIDGIYCLVNIDEKEDIWTFSRILRYMDNNETDPLFKYTDMYRLISGKISVST